MGGGQQQIATILKEFDTCKSVEQISGDPVKVQLVSTRWCRRYAGMNSKELKRLTELEVENRKLKQMYANLALDYQIA